MKYVEKWREQLKSLAPQTPIVATAEITLCGFTFTARRPPLSLWIKSGRLPQRFVRDIRKVHAGEIEEVDFDGLSIDEQAMLVDFQKKCVLEAVLDPKIVEGAPAEGEIAYYEIYENKPELIHAIVNWVLSDCPGVPVPQKDGGVLSVESLTNFREDGQQQFPIASGPDGAAILAEAQRDAENRRRSDSN